LGLGGGGPTPSLYVHTLSFGIIEEAIIHNPTVIIISFFKKK
jgi:hypothetical protein